MVMVKPFDCIKEMSNLHLNDRTCGKAVTRVTWRYAYGLAPGGKACCRKTGAEIVSAESGSSVYSRCKLLPTGPLSLLHKYIGTDIYIKND